MLVRNRMSQKVITVPPACSLDEARRLLRRHDIRQLPVVRGQRLVGILTDRDLRGAAAKAKTVADVMTPRPFVIAADAATDEAARMLRVHKINALPVVDKGRVVGILSSSDVLDAFVELSGVSEPTHHLTVMTDETRGADRRIRQLLHHVRAELKWLQHDARHPGRFHLRLRARHVDDVVDALEGAGFEVTAVVAPARKRAG